MFTICDLQLEPGRFHYITDLKFFSHASVTTLYSINLGQACVDKALQYLLYIIMTQSLINDLTTLYM